MALKTIVKITGVTTLGDARYCAGMGVDMIGFVLDADAPDYVDPAKAANIRSWLAGVQIVGETTATNPAHIEQLLGLCQPDLLQISLTDPVDPGLAAYLSTFGKRPDGCRLIVRVDPARLLLFESDTLVLTALSGADYVLLESDVLPPANDDFYALLRNIASHYPVLLDMSVSSVAAVHELLATVPVRGIALAGGSNDTDKLMDMLETLEVA